MASKVPDGHPPVPPGAPPCKFASEGGFATHWYKWVQPLLVSSVWVAMLAHWWFNAEVLPCRLSPNILEGCIPSGVCERTWEPLPYCRPNLSSIRQQEDDDYDRSVLTFSKDVRLVVAQLENKAAVGYFAVVSSLFVYVGSSVEETNHFTFSFSEKMKAKGHDSDNVVHGAAALYDSLSKLVAAAGLTDEDVTRFANATAESLRVAWSEAVALRRDEKLFVMAVTRVFRREMATNGYHAMLGSTI